MEIRYLLGQKIIIYNTDSDYDLVELSIPKKSQGPPLHMHNNCAESFLVIEGELEIMVNEKKKLLKAGDSITIPLKVWHTFNNVSDQDCICINIHKPKGFSGFFKTHGISIKEDSAIEKSISKDIIDQIIKTAKDFDMHIKNK